MILRILVLVGFLASACLLLLPFDLHQQLWWAKPERVMPAGEIQAGFELRQAVTPPDIAVPKAGPGQSYCFGILFATYARTNSGHLDVSWRQGAHSQRWRIDAAELADNSYRFFCPDPAFAVNRPFHLAITGVDGEAGRSATVWLGDDGRFGTVGSSTSVPADMAIRLQVVKRYHIGLASMLRIDNGAFLFGWVCTLLIGLASLAYGFAPNRNMATRP